MTCTRSIVGLAVAFGLAASLAAQTPPPQTPPPDRTPAAAAPSATSDKEITVAGCVRPGTEANSFMLNVADNAPTGARPTDPSAPATRPPTDPSAPRPPSDPSTARPSDPPTARPSTPESTARTTADKDKRYKLMADTASVDLKAHVGHQVQITGVVDDGSATRTPGPGAEPSPTPSSPSASKESSDAKTLRVKSVKMIASSCTGT